MNVEFLQSIRKRLKGAKEVIKWRDNLCFTVGTKMFLITTPDKTPVRVAFKVDPEHFEILCEKEGISPWRFLARHHWVELDDLRRVPQKELERLIKESYRLVSEKLPKKIRQELGID